MDVSVMFVKFYQVRFAAVVWSVGRAIHFGVRGLRFKIFHHSN